MSNPSVVPRSKIPEGDGGSRGGNLGGRSWDFYLTGLVGWCDFLLFVSMVFVCLFCLVKAHFCLFQGLVVFFCFFVWCCNVKCCLLVDADHCHANFCTLRIGKHISQNTSF